MVCLTSLILGPLDPDESTTVLPAHESSGWALMSSRMSVVGAPDLVWPGVLRMEFNPTPRLSPQTSIAPDDGVAVAGWTAGAAPPALAPRLPRHTPPNLA